MDSVESKPPSGTGISGKLVIIGIVFVAFWAAAISWYFRYNATHRAAKFWGPETFTLIRDATQVTLYLNPFASVAALAKNPAAVQSSFDKSGTDISHAPGLLHLRNALLEDQNFVWPGEDEHWPNAPVDIQHWRLEFRDPQSGKVAAMQFTQNCSQTARLVSGKDDVYELTAISTEPMAKGLREMFDEFSAPLAPDGPPGPTPPAEPAR